MRIGIDARIYGVRHGGLGRYAMRLLEGIESGKSEISKVSKVSEISFAIFMRDEEWDEYQPNSQFVEKIRVNAKWYTVKEQIVMPFLVRRARVDLMHFLHFNVPLWCPAPFIVTIHDLITLKRPDDRASTLPKWIYRLKWLLHRAIIRSALRRAQKVITPSEYTKGEILRLFPKAEAEKIVVIPMGVDLPSMSLRATTQGRGEAISQLGDRHARRGLARDDRLNILYLGVAFPHKNIETLLKSFSLLREKFPDAELIIAGPKSFFFTRLQKWAREQGLDHGARFIENPSDADREKLFEISALCAYPSLEEGFGLPPLEAMARGIPVVASRRASMPEVLGDAALYVDDPENPEEIAHVMTLLLTNDAVRKGLVERGRKQTELYSWGETAKKTIDLYHTLSS